MVTESHYHPGDIPADRAELKEPTRERDRDVSAIEIVCLTPPPALRKARAPVPFRVQLGAVERPGLAARADPGNCRR